MNIFHRFTLASLKKNRVRTLVTIVGIVLSMALLTAVIQGANSGLQFLVRAETARVGGFHGYWSEVPAGDVGRLSSLHGIRQTEIWHRVGFVNMVPSSGISPYMQIEAMDAEHTGLVSIHLTAGRMPQNEQELLLPSHLLSRIEETVYVGDTITVSVGQRSYQGELLGAKERYRDGEELADCESHTYTVVGFYERLDNLIEDSVSPCYIALTCGGGDVATVFFSIDRPTRFYDVMNGYMQEGIGYSWTAHSDLLAYSGSFRNGNLTGMMYGLVAVLIFLIAFGSISLIYNSFSISVSERTRQFGILKSVGATKKQIRGAVLYEALVLCAISIPIGAAVGCTGIGITLYCLRSSFSYLLGTGSEPIEMRLVISGVGLIVSALLCLAVCLISAWVPAKRALSVSPISAIRQANDVRITSRDVHTSALTRRLFRFEGVMAAKSFRRDRKRYRATVISLFLSVTLFISASAFCYYLTASVSDISAQDAGDDLYYFTAVDGIRLTPEDLLGRIIGVNGVKKAYYEAVSSYGLEISERALADSYLAISKTIMETGDGTTDVNVYFLSDSAFLEFCRENGIRGERYLQTEEPIGLLYNHGSRYIEEEDGTGVWKSYELLRADATLGTYRSVQVKPTVDGYYYIGQQNEAGAYLYLSQADREAYYSAELQSQREQILNRCARAVDPSDAELVRQFQIAGTVDALPMGISTGYPCLLYPYHTGEQVIGADLTQLGISYHIEAPDHTAAYGAIRSLLQAEGLDTSTLYDRMENAEAMRSTVVVIRVFCYGFIVLISLIAVANVFNTISTGISLRRRELAMLRSVGMTSRNLQRMLNYECCIYGTRALALGLPFSFLMTVCIWLVVGQAVEQPFTIPWTAVLIAAASVFAVVFATMLYAMGKVRRETIIDALKNENL